MKIDSLAFDFYGVTTEVQVDDPYLASMLEGDFGHFRVTALSSPSVRVTARQAPCPWDVLPPVPAAGHAPSHVRFEGPDGRYVWYHSGAVIHHRRARECEQATLWYTDAERSYEKLYLFILSRVGEALDRRGLHRVHALGFIFRGLGVLVVLPMRGGKSTLALALRGVEGIELISEDIPLIDRQGRLWPFPLRVSLRSGDVPPELAGGEARVLKRDSFEAKTLLPFSALGLDVRRGCTPADCVLFGRWTAEAAPSFHRLGALRGVGALLKHAVIGLGLPQVVEFFLYGGLGELTGKVSITLSRLLAVCRLVRQCELLEFRTCRDLTRNREALLEALELSAARRKKGSDARLAGQPPDSAIEKAEGVAQVYHNHRQRYGNGGPEE